MGRPGLLPTLEAIQLGNSYAEALLCTMVETGELASRATLALCEFHALLNTNWHLYT